MSIPFAQIRERLQRGAGPLPVGILATADVRGVPTARCMVMRDLTDDGQLIFVSDRRTRKDDHLRGQAACETVFWLPTINCQVRIRGEAVVVDAEGDTFTRQKWWDRLDARAIAIFTGQKPDGRPAEAFDLPPTFEVIIVNITEIEVDDLAQNPAIRTTYRL